MKPGIKAVEIALENEISERDFYLKQGKRVTNPVGKKMFDTIAKEEEKHYQQLKKIHKSLLDSGTWPEHVLSEGDEPDIKAAIKEIAESVKESAISTTDDKEAVKIAIDFEKKSRLFYSDLTSKTEVPEEKKFFSYMSAVEHRHLMSLEDTLMYLDDPVGWMMTSEKSQLDG
jgi:rubrerythrin